MKALVKPNMLSPSTPESAVITHPLVVRAVAEYFLAKDVHPLIADSPAIGSFGEILRKGGYAEYFSGLNVEIREFSGSVQRDIGKPFGMIDIAEEAATADVIVNVPKLKTHSQMTLTGAVKNLFGCIVGMRKAEWHLRAGIDLDLFARLLVQIYSTLQPAITLVDGILAMEGDGPGRSGTPRHLGYLIAGKDALAIDSIICRIVGLDPHKLPTNKAALALGYSPAPYVLDGPDYKTDNFRLPRQTPLIYGPRQMHGLIRRLLIARPRLNKSKCNGCNLCSAYCPARIITVAKRRPSIAYGQCIRCFCCVEICPEGALTMREPLLGALIRRFAHISPAAFSKGPKVPG